MSSSSLNVEVLNEFEKQLQQLMLEIFDAKLHFTQTVELDKLWVLCF